MRVSKKRKRRLLLAKGLVLGLGMIMLVLIIWIVYIFSVLIIRTVKYNEAPSSSEVESTMETSANSAWDSENESDFGSEVGNSEFDGGDVAEKLERFARENGFSVSVYPKELIELLEKNAETEEFVLNYPLKKNSFSRENLTECLNQEAVPLLMQWDSRWGYYQYGDHVIGISGCGPTCLSMVAVHLLQNPKLTPLYIADYSERNSYYVSGSGTSWELMSRGAKNLGLNVQEVPLDESKVYRYLQEGNPIICSMGPGDFTETGHFIVFTGIEGGKIKVNDPNSIERSEKLWSFTDIKYQIKNMWVYWEA